MLLIDSHCHLDRLDLSDWNHNLATLLAEAAGLGVGHSLCIGVSLEAAEDVLALAQNHARVSASVGIHPDQAAATAAADAQSDRAAALARLRELAEHRKVVAIGETGLDYFRLPDEPTAAAAEVSAQQQLFTGQLDLARELDLPAIVHTRDAGADTLALIRASGATGVIHCFTETADFAAAVLELGWYISISGIVTFRNADALRAVAQQVPLERLLVETDAPWLAPVPHRGKQNDPRRVLDVANALAELKGLSLDDLAAATTANTLRLFPRMRLAPEVVAQKVSSNSR